MNAIFPPNIKTPDKDIQDEANNLESPVKITAWKNRNADILYKLNNQMSVSTSNL